MTQANEQAIKLDQYGQVDTAYYIQKAHTLRNETIKAATVELIENTKALFSADTLVAKTA